MRKYVFFLIIILTYFVNCSKDKNPMNSPNNYSSSYFPLKVGNTWTYYASIQEYQAKTKVFQKIQINEYDYYVYGFEIDLEHADTIRIDDKDQIWKFEKNKEQLWIDFNLEDGAQYEYNSYIVTVKRNVKVNTKIGEFTNCISFHFDIPPIADDEIEYSFAKGVGMVRINSAWIDFYLKSFSLL